MRVFMGMILGALLTVMGAFIYDSVATGPRSAGSTTVGEHRGVVNWDVVAEGMRNLRVHAEQAWTKLSGKA